MPFATRITRRTFLARAAATSTVAASAASALPLVSCAESPPPSPNRSRVVIIRHDALAADGRSPAPERVRELLDEAARALAGDTKAADAWARWFKPEDRLAVKVNCLGLPTKPSVALGLAAAVGAIGLPPERVTLWDRTNRELRAAGYTLRGTGNGGYSADVYTSGATGSLISRIVLDECTALASAAVLKDHNLAGITGVMKNFYGAIHNPNKYHDGGCNPFIADVCAQKPIRDRLRLVLFDATRPQYQGGPATRRQWQWPYGGLILSTDPVAADRVGCEILQRKRAAVGMKPLEAEKRPARHIASGEARGLGTAKLERIEVVSIGRSWLDVG